MLTNIVKKSKMTLAAVLFTVSFVASAQDVQYGITPPQLNAQTYILMDYHSGAVLASLRG